MGEFMSKFCNTTRKKHCWMLRSPAQTLGFNTEILEKQDLRRDPAFVCSLKKCRITWEPRFYDSFSWVWEPVGLTPVMASVLRWFFRLILVTRMACLIQMLKYCQNRTYYYMANPVLVLSWSGFCSKDRFHGNGPTRVFLRWSEAGKFRICNQNSENKKSCKYCNSLQWNYQKKLKD